MKKLLGIATMALTFGTISLFAQNTDAQIKQLEKELRLLELQKQVEQAKQGGNQSTDTKQPQATNKQAQSNKSKCGNDYTFTSCYFGVELGVTLGSSATYLQSKMGATKYSGVSDAKTGGTYLAMTAQLIGGYQWYFHDKMGLGINALLGYGGSSAHSTFTYTAITWGADLQYLVDFTRIFGISAGLGFEMVHFIYADTIISSSAYAPAFTAGIGIHFNTENLKHRFSINYKYRLYKDATIETSATKVLIKHGGVGLISVSYMYRF